ncbi:glucose 1-dehydrogenase [Saccharopolyspora hirsuta]|nr:glucose 1-dehydrogenase [Saccharopolyspora hirsuta]
MTVVPGRPDTAATSWLPEPGADDGDVLVEGLAVGICATDREIVRGGHGSPPPGQRNLVLGHESLGRVLSAPDGDIAVGDLVVGIVRRPDDCSCCRAGNWDFCRTGNYLERGIEGAHGYGSERWRAPAEYLVRVAPDLADTGVLLEPTSVVAKAWEQIDHIRGRSGHDGRTALITGAGPIGLLAALLAVQRGYETHVYDRVEGGTKPDLVRALGGTYHCGEASDLPVRPDAVVEATGAASLLADLVNLVAPNAVICLTGISTGTRAVLPGDELNNRLVLRNGVVLGSVNAARRHYEQAGAALAAADQDWLHRLLNRRVPLANWPAALDRRTDDVKVVVDLT